MSPTRRDLLRGLGAGLALPLLPSLAPRAWATDTFPTRVLFFYSPNGYRMEHWRPTGEGTSFSLGPSMAQLADIQDQLLVVSGLRVEGAFGGGIPGDHARGTAAFLTCAHPDREQIGVGISIDQVIANEVGGQTPFQSLELGAHQGTATGQCDSGYPCAYQSNISWASPTHPRPKLTDATVVFDRLFGESGTGYGAEAASRRGGYRGSVFTLVKEHAGLLKSSVSSEDWNRLDEYLDGVRELERRAAGFEACAADHAVPEILPDEDLPDMMLDLLVDALRCDLTRVGSFMLSNGGGNDVYSFLPGVTSAHHEASHHQGLARNLDQLSTIDRWTLGRVGRLLRRLAAVPEGSGTLLDHTIVVVGSEISDGDRHNHDDMPILLAGGSAAGLALGRHVVAQGEALANVYLAILQQLGISRDTFGVDGTRPVSWLTG